MSGLGFYLLVFNAQSSHMVLQEMEKNVNVIKCKSFALGIYPEFLRLLQTSWRSHTLCSLRCLRTCLVRAALQLLQQQNCLNRTTGNVTSKSCSLSPFQPSHSKQPPHICCISEQSLTSSRLQNIQSMSSLLRTCAIPFQFTQMLLW